MVKPSNTVLMLREACIRQLTSKVKFIICKGALRSVRIIELVH